jgi:di/tricarboxylate transporter
MLVRVLRHYVPLSLVALGVAEALILFGAICPGAAIRFPAVVLSSAAALQISPIFPKALLFALVMLGAVLAFELPQSERSQGESSL